MAYEPWLGMDCTNTPESAWLTPLDGGTVGGDWFEWKLDPSELGFNDPMVPVTLQIRPHQGMDTAWYAAHNPAYLKAVGVLPDGSYDDANPFLELDPVFPKWDNGNTKSFDIFTDVKYIGFRIYVRSWNSVNVDVTDNHTGWCELKMYGSLTGNPPLTALNPDGSTMLNPDGSVAVNPK